MTSPDSVTVSSIQGVFTGTCMLRERLRNVSVFGQLLANCQAGGLRRGHPALECRHERFDLLRRASSARHVANLVAVGREPVSECCILTLRASVSAAAYRGKTLSLPE
jgi:hypothetical protein